MIFMAVGEHIGIMTTLLLAVLTAIIGGMIVKHQGIQTLIAMRIAAEHGKMPISEIFDGFCLVIAGAMLITPGFVTDTLGFLLLVPAIRLFIKTMLKKHTSWTLQSHEFYAQTRNIDPNIIEGECEHMSNDNNSIDSKD